MSAVIVNGCEKILRVDNEGCESEHHARETSRVFHELTTGQILYEVGNITWGLTFSRLKSVSKMSPASGSSLLGSGCACCTLLE